MKTVVAVALVGATFIGLSSGARAAEPAVPVYSAVYQVEYKGRTVGTTEFAVTFDAATNAYEFTSRTTARGLLKLLAPANPVVERSHFLVVNDRVRPVEFWYEDGRKGENNKHVEFDWDKRVAVVSAKDGRREVALDDSTLDSGSVQVALMQDLIKTGHPGKYSLATDEAKSYEYVDRGEATTTTGVGTLATRSFVQQREGSSRSTWLWAAPELRYLPARIESRKDNEVQTALTLMSVEGIKKQ
jgi:hypothetical protein